MKRRDIAALTIIYAALAVAGLVISLRTVGP